MRILELFVLCLLATAFCCCSEAPQSAAKGTPTNPYVIGMSQCNLQEPWRQQMNADLEQAAKPHPELRLVFKDAANDSRRQQEQVAEFVASGVDLLIISPKEAVPLTRPVGEAYKKGIPVIVLDRAVMGQEFTCFIGGDNLKIGRAAGRWIRQALGGKGKIVELMGLQTSTPGQDRHQGFVEGARQKDADPALKVVFQADMKWLETEARKEMASALAVHREIDLVYAHNDPGAHGAWLAARQAGREKDIKFVGIDALPHEGLAYVEQGILDATFLYPTGGAEAIARALDILAGKSVPKKIVLGTRVYTRENLATGGEVIR